MKNRIVHLLKGHSADYIEARFEKSFVTRLTYRGGRLEGVARTASVGGNIRALVNGGWGFVSFNCFDKLREGAELAVQEARLAGREKVQLDRQEPVVETVTEEARKKAADVPLLQKKQVLDEYNDIILRRADVVSSRIDYHDIVHRTVFANSDGTYIEQEKPSLALRLTAVARKGGEVQQAGVSLGSRGDFSAVEGLHDEAERVAKRAVALLSAPVVKGGEYTVVLDPVLAGVFTHEAFGHLSEADFVYQNEKLAEIMTMGRRFGGKQLNIVDDATLPGLRGSYKYDDEGVPAARNYLIREGVLVGRLHSRETAARMNERPSGNARAINHRYPPIVRMSNTFIEQGEATLEEMFGGIKEGVYLKDWYGGMTSLEMFTFSAGEAYMIRQGKVEELLRPVVLSGNVFATLGNIEAIGNDLEMNQGGGCGKGGQFPLPVSDGSPHIRIARCVVGGK